MTRWLSCTVPPPLSQPTSAGGCALTVAGTGASALWFLAVLRKAGLRLRFAPA